MTTPSSPPVPLLVDSRQAAKMLAISTRTLWALTQRGEVSCVRVGRAVRYALSDLQRFVETRKGAPHE